MLSQKQKVLGKSPYGDNNVFGSNTSVIKGLK